MHLHLLYVTLFALVIASLPDVLALPTGSRWSSLDRRMDSISSAQSSQVADVIQTVFDFSAFLPRITWQSWCDESGEHSVRTGEPASPEDVAADFKNHFPLAQLAYETDFDKVKAAMKEFSNHMVDIGHTERDSRVTKGHPPAYAFVETEKKILFLFYAGTGSFADILVDADGRLIQADEEHFIAFHKHEFKLHKGFMDNMVIHYAPQIKTWVQTAVTKYHVAAILQTGHSLGGALATLGHIVLKDAMDEGHLPKVDLETRSFAGPRVMNPAGARYFAEHYPNFRAFHLKKDIVGRLGPLKMGFQHPEGVETHDAGGSGSEGEGKKKQRQRHPQNDKNFRR